MGGLQESFYILRRIRWIAKIFPHTFTFIRVVRDRPYLNNHTLLLVRSLLYSDRPTLSTQSQMQALAVGRSAPPASTHKPHRNYLGFQSASPYAALPRSPESAAPANPECESQYFQP